MKKIILLSFCCFCCVLVSGQQRVEIWKNYDKEQYRSNQTTSLVGGRWEFFMSEIIDERYKIDKFTGEVYVMVQKKGDYKTLTWQIVSKLEKEPDIRDIQKEDCINYQLFSSGMSFRDTYLLNTNTGLTWQIVADKQGVSYFNLIE
jgi:hypothetical protein